MMNKPQALEPLTLPLFGERLIEASAGTGKTYTLAALYLRLLLGLGGTAAYCRPLSVEEILVVTFTEAATDELRGRIRDNIHALRIACVRGSSKDYLLNGLLQQIDNKPAAASLLLAAERQMDEAAIYTIHGFCQRMLAHNAFESGMLFEQALIQDEQPLRRQATADFWRRHCYPLPLAVVKAIGSEWRDPEALLADLMPYLQGEAPTLRQPEVSDEQLLERHQQIVEKIDLVKQGWLADAVTIDSLIKDSDVDKRSYSSRNLPNWLAKVTEWAEQETEDYQLPKALDYFRQSVLQDKTKKGQPPVHPLFTYIERLYDQPLTLRDLLLARALSEVRFSIQVEKNKHAQIGFDDLLSRLDAALRQPGAGLLADAIRRRYPVALIDEFQDTDPQQYRIFHRLYGGRQDNGLLLIGDPKQAIYAFRGADIFTYMQARSEVAEHYTMATNWRSSAAMVQSVNRLFSRIERPFIFEQIPFTSVNSAEKNQQLGFEINGQDQPAMQFWLQHGEAVGLAEYHQTMAQQCASQISRWLDAGQQQQAFLVNGESKKPVSAADIAILVRTGREAALVRDALSGLNIPSVYLSNRDSVFRTPEARDILWLLQAVLTPENERTLRSALASTLLGLNAQQIDRLNQNERDWDALVVEFGHYRQHWLKRGVLPMLQEVLLGRHLAETLLVSEQGERRLTDILHIGELLQEASLNMESEHALVRWLAQQIDRPNDRADSQQLRLESDRNLVKIVTIHKSKGLEYPLVWLPFICHYRSQQNALYHDRESFRAILDLQGSEDAQLLADEERLAEDLRLLYVATTRSIYHCSIGIAPLFAGSRKKTGATDLHHSALGYLLQQGNAGDSVELQRCLTELAGEGIAVKPIEIVESLRWQPQTEASGTLSARVFNRQLRNDWQVTSYSGLQQHGSQSSGSQSHGHTENYALLPRFDVDAAGEGQAVKSEQLTPYTFPKGAAPGTFLHSLLEPLDFTQPLDLQWLAEKAQAFSLAPDWLPVLQQWLMAIVDSPLDQQGISLAKIPPTQKQAELQFYLPISSPLQAEQLDALVRRYDPLSARCPELDFRQVRGMLKGFIDLVFCWQGRYYVLDFKSNWLGEDATAYHQSAMEQAMCEHRYDLQYQLYTLALHRYLRHRLPDYDFQRHFGGVFYLFLRGMSSELPGQGVFHCRPQQEMVEGMDRLFNGDNASC